MQPYNFKLKKAIYMSIGAIIAFSIFCFLFYFFLFEAPTNFRDDSIVSIPPGSSLQSLSKNLVDQNIIKSRVAFEAFVIIFGGEKHILPGDYLFQKPISVYEIARRISVGERHLAPVKITIPEGFNIEDISNLVSQKLPNFNKDKFFSLARNKEGYLFPDTYFYFITDNEEDVISRMSENFEKKVAPIRAVIQNSGREEKQIIIMASIIEREAKGDSDRGIISGILWNRLKIGMPLQVDAAPITYKEKGLPNMPISNPGLEAINAALHPESSPYLYYLHGNDGQVHYAKTFDEHRQNKLKYLR